MRNGATPRDPNASRDPTRTSQGRDGDAGWEHREQSRCARGGDGRARGHSRRAQRGARARPDLRERDGRRVVEALLELEGGGTFVSPAAQCIHGVARWGRRVKTAHVPCLVDVLAREQRRRRRNELAELDVRRAQPLEQLAQRARRELCVSRSSGRRPRVQRDRARERPSATEQKNKRESENERESERASEPTVARAGRGIERPSRR